MLIILIQMWKTLIKKLEVNDKVSNKDAQTLSKRWQM